VFSLAGIPKKKAARSGQTCDFPNEEIQSHEFIPIWVMTHSAMHDGP
jgi:hypothetical protein